MKKAVTFLRAGNRSAAMKYRLIEAEKAYDGSHQTYGAPRVQLELADEHQVRVGRKRVARLMRELRIEGVSRRSGKRRTTVPDPKAPAAPDLVERRFEAERPNALWLADITYVPTCEGYLFLGVVMDMFSRKIVGWSMGDDLKADLVVDALAMAVTRRRPPAGLVLTIRIAAVSTPRSPSAGRCASPGSLPRWAAGGTPSTMPPASR